MKIVEIWPVDKVIHIIFFLEIIFPCVLSPYLLFIVMEDFSYEIRTFF